MCAISKRKNDKKILDTSFQNSFFLTYRFKPKSVNVAFFNYHAF